MPRSLATHPMWVVPWHSTSINTGASNSGVKRADMLLVDHTMAFAAPGRVALETQRRTHDRTAIRHDRRRLALGLPDANSTDIWPDTARGARFTWCSRTRRGHHTRRSGGVGAAG